LAALAVAALVGVYVPAARLWHARQVRACFTNCRTIEGAAEAYSGDY